MLQKWGYFIQQWQGDKESVGTCVCWVAERKKRLKVVIFFFYFQVLIFKKFIENGNTVLEFSEWLIPVE